MENHFAESVPKMKIVLNDETNERIVEWLRYDGTDSVGNYAAARIESLQKQNLYLASVLYNRYCGIMSTYGGMNNDGTMRKTCLSELEGGERKCGFWPNRNKDEGIKCWLKRAKEQYEGGDSIA